MSGTILYPVVDLKAAASDIDHELQAPGTAADAEKPRPRRRWIFRLGVVFALLGGMLLWLDGPGLRWLGPRVAAHFMGKAGIRGNFTIDGSLTRGITISKLTLGSDTTLAILTAERIRPLYQIGGLVKGRLRGIEIDGLHADIRLGVKKENPEDKAPLDLDKLVRTLRAARGRFVPLSITLKDISLNVGKEGKPVIALASSNITHAAGDADLNLELGAITDANGRVWPARKTALVWNAEGLSISRIDPLPGVSIRDFVLNLPETGGPSADAEIRVDDAVFIAGATPGFGSVSMDLREGRLPGGKIAERFGMKLPADGVLTSLSVNVDGLLPDPKAATGAARLLLENVVSGDWSVPQLSLDVGLETERATVAAGGRALDTGFSINAEAPVSRTNGAFKPGDIQGRFNVADVPKLIAALSDRVKAIDPAAPVPESSVDGNFIVAMKNLKPASADVDLVLKPADPKVASPVSIKAKWLPDQPLTAKVEADGLKADAQYDLTAAAYDATLLAESFQSSRIDRWLAIVKADTHGGLSLTGNWRGKGVVKTGKHQGALALGRVDWSREGTAPLTAEGEVQYDWPGNVSTKGLHVHTADQDISADVKLAGGMLEMTGLRWIDHGNEIAGGSAKLPVPEDFAKWRETLANDERPLDVSIQSKVLSLAVLKDWLPAAGKLDARSTGRLDVKITGTYEAPVIDATLEAKDLRSLRQPKLPPAGLILKLAAREGRISLDGNLTAPDFPAAVISASMPFRPAAWAEEPGLVKGEAVSVRADLPRIDVSRFASLVPAADKLAGIVTGNVEVAGVIGKPVFKGHVELTGGALGLKNDKIPDIAGVGAAIDLTLDRIDLKSFKATTAGGTVQGGGSLAIADGKPGNLDFRLTGDHLPLLRNDSIIVRANTDLRLSGPFERAALTGTVGVVDSLFFRDIELIPMGTPFTGPSAAAVPKLDAPANPASSVPEPFRNWSLNVLLRTVNPFLIRGNLATGRIDANIRLGGTLGNPAPDGEARLSDVEASLPFSTLRVRSGFARFSPATGFDPILEIRGTAEPRPYQVNVFVYGRASDPQLVLTSNPPLPDNEIMTLLATGTTTSGLENPQAASTRAMQLLVEEMRRGRFGVGKQLRPVLKLLDRVDFSIAEADPYSNDSYSTATLAITDRWFLSAGMGQEGDSRVLAVWRISFR